MIGLSATTSSGGAIRLKETSQNSLYNSELRSTRSKTLDSGTVIVNSGADYGDQTFTIDADITAAEFTIIDGLHRNQTRITIATKTGLFSGIIKRMAGTGKGIRLTLEIESRLDT